MKNYIGYFRGVQSDTYYSVRITADSSSTEYTEVVMAGEEPFVVNYDEPDNIFEGIRQSTATIKVVNNDYMLDCFTAQANGTLVELYDETNEKTKWKGYLKPNLYSQGYSQCYETIELEASDLVSALQYFDYADMIESDVRQVLSFNAIISKIFNKIGNIDAYYVARSKNINSSVIDLNTLTISEENFFSSDTEDGWKCNEVIEEMCKYLGYSLIQVEDKMVFADWSYYRKKYEISYTKYEKSATGAYTKGAVTTLGDMVTIEDNSKFRGNGHSFSMDNIYNEAVVNCSTYAIDELLPDIYDDEDNITPMYGDWTNCQYIIPAASKGRYVNEKGREATEEEYDNKYTYVNRFLTNKNYESTYYDFNLKKVKTTTSYSISPMFVSYTPTAFSFEYESNTGDGGYETMNGYTAVAGRVQFTNNDSASHTIQMYVEITGTRNWHFRVYDAWAPEGSEIWYSACGNQDGEYYGNDREHYNHTYTITVAAGSTGYIDWGYEFKQKVAYANDANGKVYTTMFKNVDYYGYYRIDGGASMDLPVKPFGGDKTSSSPVDNYIGCTLLDYASYDRIPSTEYNFEPTASLSFTRYLCINQHNQPYGTIFGPGKIVLPTPDGTKTWEASEDLFPCLYKLKSGFKRPLVTGKDTFIAIDANVIYERYVGRAYINGDWTSKATGINNSIFCFRDQTVGTCAGALVLKLGFGDYFWNGSAWTTTETVFRVPISTNVDDDYKADLSDMWNTNFHILNNFSWEEWADAEGYKIPLDGVDTSQEITFEIHLPSKLQFYENSKDSLQTIADASLNGFCWITDFAIKIANKGQDVEDDSDIVYQNVIDNTSINEIDEIDLKINTNPNRGPLSYSYVGYNGGYLETVADLALDGEEQKPEENLIERIVTQYSTTTKKEQLEVNMDFNPLSKVIDKYWDSPFLITGQEIDYKSDIQKINLTELK